MKRCPSPEALLRLDRQIAEPARSARDRRSASHTHSLDPPDSLASHLASCRDCAERMALLRALGIHLALDAPPWPDVTDCPDAFEIAAFAEGTCPAADADVARRHIGSCPRCLASLDAALTEIRATSPAVTSAATASTSSLASRLWRLLRPRPALWVPLSSAIVLVVVWVMRPADDEVEIGGLARIAPIELRATRSVPDAPDTSEPTAADRARTAYVDGRFAQATLAYAVIVAANPGDLDARLFLGSSRLLAGDPAGAVNDLSLVVEAASGARLRTARWQRAQARLLLEDRRGALDDLTLLAGSPGRHRDDAEAQVAALSASDVRSPE